MHPLLARQIRRYLKETDPLPEGLREFMASVDKAYHENDDDRHMLERAFDLSSQELMKLNEDLLNALSRFEFVIENAPFIAIQGVDRKGIVVHWNRACLETYGYSAEEAKGRRIQDLLFQDLPTVEFEDTLARIWLTKKPTQPREWETRNRFGETRWVYSTMFPIIEGDEVIEVFCMDLDMTERKQLESRLLQAQKMEAIGTLAGGIAHDFNNLLMGIQGYTQLMLLDFEPGHPHYDRLKRIEMQLQSGAELSEQLLGFARGGRYEVKSYNLNAIIEQTAQTFGRTKKEIAVFQRLFPGLWTVEVDKGQIEQVLLNLFINAWHAMPTGGTLYISTENVMLNEADTKSYGLPAGRYAKASVTDTGIGMDAETRARIFEPFFTTKEMGRGTGLGLAMVYGIIRAHKGIINVYSEAGHGSTFNLFLPASDKDAALDRAYPEEVTPGRGTVLVVDDEEFILEVISELLKKLGYSVVTARGGREAANLYREGWRDIDLIILDMIMPEMGGDATFDTLRTINPEARIILASGYSLTGHATRLMEKGAVAYIQKPYRFSELSRKIAEAING